MFCVLCSHKHWPKGVKVEWGDGVYFLDTQQVEDWVLLIEEIGYQVPTIIRYYDTINTTTTVLLLLSVL